MRKKEADFQAGETPPRGRRGRGALSNADGRFEPYARDAFDDGWGSLGLLLGSGIGRPFHVGDKNIERTNNQDYFLYIQ